MKKLIINHAVAVILGSSMIVESADNVPSWIVIPGMETRVIKSQRPYEGVVKRITKKHMVDTQLVHAVIQTESNYNPRALSSAGAQGLMQLMPATAKRYGVEDVWNPESNIEGGVLYLRDLIKRYGGGRLDLALAAYNAGEIAVQKYNGIPPYQETQRYVKSVLAIYEVSEDKTPEVMAFIAPVP